MSRKSSITKAQVFISLLLLASLVLASPHLIRLFNNDSALMGEEPYYHARMSRQIAERGLFSQDNMIQGSRPYTLNPYHAVLASCSAIFGIITASKLVPLIAGMIFVLLFYLALKELKFSNLNRITITIVLILSPVFIYIFSISGPWCVMILLDMAGFYLLLQKNEKYSFASIAIFAAASFFSLLNLIMIFILVFSYSLSFKKKMKKLYILSVFLIIVFFSYHIDLFFKQGFRFHIAFPDIGLIQNFITDLGGIKGFSIFALLLSIFGLAVAWKNKQKLYKAYLVMIAVILFSFFYNPAVTYSNFIISILAGLALGSLIRRKWKLNIIRNLSILLLFCGLLFSAVSFTVRLSEQQPKADLIDALEWIKENSDKEDAVFTHYTKGFFVQFYAERPVVADSIIYPGFDERKDDSSKIFYSWDIELTRDLLAKYNSSLILLTDDMSEGLVWDKPEQGLAYLVRNSETFKKVYSNEKTGVWMYIYKENE